MQRVLDALRTGYDVEYVRNFILTEDQIEFQLEGSTYIILNRKQQLTEVLWRGQRKYGRTSKISDKDG